MSRLAFVIVELFFPLSPQRCMLPWGREPYQIVTKCPNHCLYDISTRKMDIIKEKTENENGKQHTIENDSIQFNGENTDRLLPDYDSFGHTFFCSRFLSLFRFNAWFSSNISNCLHSNVAWFTTLLWQRPIYFFNNVKFVIFPFSTCNNSFSLLFWLHLFLFHSSYPTLFRSEPSSMANRERPFTNNEFRSATFNIIIWWSEMKRNTSPNAIDCVNCGQNSLIVSIPSLQINYQSKKPINWKHFFIVSNRFKKKFLFSIQINQTNRSCCYESRQLVNFQWNWSLWKLNRIKNSPHYQ